MSTAYYAVFHCIANNAANPLVGRSRDDAWHRVYRALEHGAIASACENKAAMKRFPPEIHALANRFRNLRKERERADYALEARFYKSSVLANIVSAESAIRDFERASPAQRRAFSTHVLFKPRRS